MFFFLRGFHSEIKLTIPKRALTAEQERSLRELATRESAPSVGDGVDCRFVLRQEELDESSAAGHSLLGSKYGIAFVYATEQLPVSVFLLVTFMRAIPQELDEAALIDGASYLQLLTKIFIPVALPGIIAATAI